LQVQAVVFPLTAVSALAMAGQLMTHCPLDQTYPSKQEQAELLTISEA